MTSLAAFEGDDPILDRPVVDIDETRGTVDAAGATNPYRYVEGGFVGTPARFACYFPIESYAHRFFQLTYPTFATVDADPDFVAFALRRGAYVVSTNNAGGLVHAPDGIAAFRLNAAAARVSRVIAAEVYADDERPRGYICGGSGGAYQTIGAVENTVGVWDGAVPMVPGSPNAIPNCQSTQVLALHVLGPALARIADAVAPGGRGDPEADLDDEQRAVWREVTRFGFPRRGWWQHQTLYGGSFDAVAGAVRAMDPGYVDDFWSMPGYAGGDRSSVLTREQPDDRESAWAIALRFYHRHQVPPVAQRGWNHLCDEAGQPRYPQRPILVGPPLAAATAGSVPCGRFDGKMIMLASTMDVEAYPWMADWYRHQVEANLGAGAADRFRLWFTDNADHDAPKTKFGAAHVVSYRGSLERALLDLDDWVTTGAAPPKTSGYTIDADNQVVLASSARERGGVQPAVELRIVGIAGERIEVRRGTTVEFDAAAETADHVSAIVATAWDFEGSGAFEVHTPVPGVPAIAARGTHTYEQPGTYFASIRVTSQREGDPTNRDARVENLARVRVVVRD